MANILIGVTGSVAAIKTMELAVKLKALGQVKLVLTENAEYFVRPDYDELSRHNISIHRDKDEWPPLRDRYDLDSDILHIELRRWANCFLLAPLDANTLAKISAGICDNLLTSVARAWDWQRPLIVCPAMNTFMWENEPTGKQLEILKAWGALVVDPVAKQLACKDIGMGAMAPVDEIVARIKSVL